MRLAFITFDVIFEGRLANTKTFMPRRKKNLPEVGSQRQQPSISGGHNVNQTVMMIMPIISSIKQHLSRDAQKGFSCLIFLWTNDRLSQGPSPIKTLNTHKKSRDLLRKRRHIIISLLSFFLFLSQSQGR